jgi:hypothetical protein
MWWHSWLRHCSTSCKVAGSIPEGVSGIFHWHNSSSCNTALGLTQPLTEMSTRNIFWGEVGGGRRLMGRADNLTTFMCRLSWNVGVSTSWNPLGLSRLVMGLLHLYLLQLKTAMLVLPNNGQNYVPQINFSTSPLSCYTHAPSHSTCSNNSN